MTTPPPEQHKSEREEFETALSGKPEARFWNTSDAMFWAFQAGRASMLRPIPEVEGWRPISEAPKDGSMFLCWVQAERYGETDEGQQYQQDASQADFCWWRPLQESPDGGYFDPACGQIGDRQFVSHWMPLPSPPSNVEPA